MTTLPTLCNYGKTWFFDLSHLFFDGFFCIHLVWICLYLFHKSCRNQRKKRRKKTILLLLDYTLPLLVACTQCTDLKRNISRTRMYSSGLHTTRFVDHIPACTGGVCPGGVSDWGVYVGEGLSGGVCLWSGEGLSTCGPGGSCVSQHAIGQTLTLWTESQTPVKT